MSSEMGFLEHFAELRKRMLHSVLGILICFLFLYSFSEEIFSWLMQPLCKAFSNYECQLITIGVAEAFIVYLKTALVAAVFCSFPWIVFQIWRFVSPGLHSNEKKYVIPFIFSASFMFVGGAAFGYFLVFPFAFEFFLGLAGEQIVPSTSMASYFGFTTMLLFAFGFLFEIPVVVVLLNLLGVVSSASLWRTWRYAIVGIFALSAILTPADPFTMIMLALPLSVLYITSLLVCSLIDKSRNKAETAPKAN